MVELRKRPAPPPAPPPAKKKSTSKAKAKPKIDASAATKEEVPLVPEPAPAPAIEDKAPAAAVEEKASAPKGGPPKVGDHISLHVFGGELQTNDAKQVTLADLVEESKAGVVLFTYPKASTPGCTNQVCLFRDSYAPLTATGLSIFGLSNDSPKANSTFKAKQNLPYPLLCDPDLSLISAIGMKKAPKGTTRGVFIVDKAGKVLAAEAGSPAGAVEVVKTLVEKMGGANTQGMDHLNDKVAAETAAEVADIAATMDKSKTSTPLPA